ncbi:MAG: UDP-N-acetylmuramoyl-L-alanine--D-glutamate ligase [Betaproteobacteria bacterium]|nr:MAG: UDP-N-acetylmuramoyl-L-alanine--D-glutamate ligase [Betaproteobacteria bacterium]
MLEQSLANCRVNVVGLGATGLSLVRHLHARGAAITVFDGSATPAAEAQIRQSFPSVAVKRHDVARDPLPPCDLIALSPGVPRSSFALDRAIKAGIEVVGDIELFARSVSSAARVFAVTGSNGKTTTTSIAGAMAKRVDADTVVAGNIGLPILDALAAQPTSRTWVLELSSFQLESTRSLMLENAAVLNVSANHLDRYPSFFDYAASKASIFSNAKRQVINRDDAWSSAMSRTDVAQVSFGSSAPVNEFEIGLQNLNGEPALAHGHSVLIETSKMRLRGEHNWMNAMAAYALTLPLSPSADDVEGVLRTFAGVAHRYQWLGRVQGVEIINDSKATTVVASSAALSGNRAPTWLIAGGDGKGQSFDELADVCGHCKAVHLIGKDAATIAAALDKKGIPHHRFDSLEDAVSSALDQAKAGDVLLLSPACASWDMFRNFEHRAECFELAVRQWARSHSVDFEEAGQHA